MTTATATRPTNTGSAGVTTLGIVSLVFAILLPLIGLILGSIAGIRARAAGGSDRFANGVMFLAAVIMIGELIFLAGWGLPQLLN